MDSSAAPGEAKPCALRLAYPCGLGYRVHLGHVVPGALHGPDLIVPGAEGLPGVDAHADVDDQRPAVQDDDERAEVVVVAAFAVVAGLRGQEQPGRRARPRPGRGEAGGGQPRLGRHWERARRLVRPPGIGQGAERPAHRAVGT